MTTAEFIIEHSADAAGERKRELRKILAAFAAALFLHLLIAFSLATWSGALPPAVPVEDKPIELTFVDLAPAPPKNSIFVPNEDSDQPEPVQKTFESNANSTAASELDAAGNAPVPSQDGRDQSWVNLQTQSHSLAVEGAQPQPSAQPEESPQPTAAPNQFAMLTKTTPPPVEQATPARQQPPKSAYRPEQQQTRMRGNISKRGISAVNAVGTPLGRYRKQLYDAVGSRWYYHVGRSQDLVSIGTAQVVFLVDRNGRVKNLKLIRNSSNEIFANVCLEAVQDVQLPSMSDDIASTLPPEGLEEEMSFTIYAN